MTAATVTAKASAQLSLLGDGPPLGGPASEPRLPRSAAEPRPGQARQTTFGHKTRDQLAAEQRAAEVKGEKRRQSEADNLNRFGTAFRDLRAFAMCGRHRVTKAADGAPPTLTIELRDDATAEAIDGALYGAWQE